MAIQVAIEGYDSLEQIGVGGMAAVYRARQVSIDKIVAIKLLFPYLATDASYIERFQREAKAAASIQHENIVNVIDCGESDGAFYIVMEYYDGRTLEQLMKERPGLPPEIAIQILLEVAYGLEAAHAADIVHRDIKPANIIYTNQGGIKIADFGLARKSDSMTMITQHGKVIGTPAYMSPEQAAGNPVGPASDIFSFGVVAYELLGRRKPFDGRTYSEVLDQIQSHHPEPVSMANPLVAPEFERIVTRALAKDQGARYAAAGELIADIEAAMEKNQLARDRRRLVSYAKDPDQYDATFKQQTIAQCLSRGAFFVQKGNTHLQDALLEYRRVLYLDPGHRRAQSSLAKLSAEDGGESKQPSTPRSEAAVDAEPTRVLDPARPRRTPAPSPRRRTLPWVVVGVVAVAIAGAALVFGPEDPNHTMQAEHRANEIGLLTTHADSLATALREPRMTASTGDAMGPFPVLDAPAKNPGDAKETTRPQEKSPATEKPTTKATESRPLASDLRKEQSGSTSPRPAPGWLSVFFLGGVGELWVDGKLFAQQPPFEKASIAAGTHRIACQMKGQARREITVTIEPGKETVIEYEVGGEPVVVTE